MRPESSDLAADPYGHGTLPAGIRSRRIEHVNGLKLHLLECGHTPPGRPLLLLLHGFPELAYSWRRVMLPLAAAGFHVAAPDRRGYGRSSGRDCDYDSDPTPFGVHNQVRDLLALLEALEVRRVAAVIGHDYGAPLAGWAALLHPEVFDALVLMSAPFTGAPAAHAPAAEVLDGALAALPRPRRHYLHYYTTRDANADLQRPPQGLNAFLRAYFHAKSADWAGNRPHPLADARAATLAELPTYYLMDRARSMAQTVAEMMPSAAQIADCRWLPEAELGVYVEEYARTGFQGGLNEYRCDADPSQVQALRAWAGRRIEVPTLFLAGRQDWGVYQSPGALERMRATCTALAGIHLIEGAGHWVQQEQPGAWVEALLPFLRASRR